MIYLQKKKVMWYDIIKDVLSSDAGSFGFVFFALSLIGWVRRRSTD